MPANACWLGGAPPVDTVILTTCDFPGSSVKTAGSTSTHKPPSSLSTSAWKVALEAATLVRTLCTVAAPLRLGTDTEAMLRLRALHLRTEEGVRQGHQSGC